MSADSAPSANVDPQQGCAPGNGPGNGRGNSFGTFLGVFTPTILTILGVIMYLRVGWVVGNAGVLGTIAIVLLANGITLVTALSLSTLSTNMRVGAGGAYWLISRCMGLEIGGALGIPLFLSQALSLTLYSFGLAESMRILWPGAPVQLLAGLFVMLVVLVASRSTRFALRMQLPILGLIVLSLASLFLGVDWGTVHAQRLGPWVDGGFWTVFAVFFPAVTGVLAGVGLSGDLKDPGRSIPRGVIAAVLVGLLVYLVVPLALARVADPLALRSDPLIWTKTAWVGVLVLPGLWGAIFSSAIGSILTAPRTLQALAADGLLPASLSRVDPTTQEPVLALRISGGLALFAVALGNLNVVAAVVTMFFLTTYGMLNLAAGLEDLVKDTSFRPRIRTPWWVSLLGAFGCFVAMWAINPTAFIAAVTIEAMIWWYLGRRAMKGAWGDVRAGVWYALARFVMLRLRTSAYDPRHWRPHILVFTANLARSLPVVRLANRFSQDHGIVTVNTMLVGDLDDLSQAERLAARNQELLRSHNLLVFCEVTAVPNLASGIVTITQAHGFGGLQSNMVLLGWPADQAGLARLLGITRRLARLDKSTMILRPGPGGPLAGDGDIVVWWKGKESNGDLMLLLAHLLTLSQGWRRTKIRLCSIVDTQSLADELHRSQVQMLEETRIAAQVHVYVRAPGQTINALMVDASSDASLVFLGLPLPQQGEEDAIAARILEHLHGLPSAILVRNGGPFRGRLV